MNLREAVEAVYEAGPHIPPRGTIEYHTRQLRDLLAMTNKRIATIVASLPTKEARATVARKRAHEVYELEVREAAARRDAALARADAATDEARAELVPLEAQKDALLRGTTALTVLPRNASGAVDWAAVRKTAPQHAEGGWTTPLISWLEGR